MRVPTATSRSSRGSRPSRTGGSMRPTRGSRTSASASRPRSRAGAPSSMAMPSTLGSRLATGIAARTAAGPSPLRISASHVTPYWCGLSRRWVRLAPKVSAVTTAHTPIAAPARLVATGIAPRPRPRCSAMRTPAVIGTGAPARASASATVDDRWGASLAVSNARASRAARHAGHTASATTSRIVRPTPAARMLALTEMPGSGSARRAVPMGVNVENRTAGMIARTAPVTARTSARNMPSSHSWRGVMPSPRRIG